MHSTKTCKYLLHAAFRAPARTVPTVVTQIWQFCRAAGERSFAVASRQAQADCSLLLQRPAGSSAPLALHAGHKRADGTAHRAAQAAQHPRAAAACCLCLFRQQARLSRHTKLGIVLQCSSGDGCVTARVRMDAWQTSSEQRDRHEMVHVEVCNPAHGKEAARGSTAHLRFLGRVLLPSPSEQQLSKHEPSGNVYYALLTCAFLASAPSPLMRSIIQRCASGGAPCDLQERDSIIQESIMPESIMQESIMMRPFHFAFAGGWGQQAEGCSADSALCVLRKESKWPVLPTSFRCLPPGCCDKVLHAEPQLAVARRPPRQRLQRRPVVLRRQHLGRRGHSHSRQTLSCGKRHGASRHKHHPVLPLFVNCK